jgi:hypothetical protein
MDESTFIEMQRKCFDLVSAILKVQVPLSKNLEISTINETVLEDLAVYGRTGYLMGHVEFLMSASSTAGVGLPIRLVAYYNRKPLGYLSGSLDGGKFLIYHWELSDASPDEMHLNWVKIILSSLEYLAVCVEEYSQIKVTYIAFTSPMAADRDVFERAGFDYSEDIHKCMPAFYVKR